MITLEELDQMSRMEIEQADKSRLADIQAISIDPLQPTIMRMETYLEHIKNPYLFLCGDTVVRIRFESDGKELAGKLKDYFENLKTG